MKFLISKMKKIEKLLIKKYESYISSRDVYFNYLEKYQNFSTSVLKHCRQILIEYNTSFEFERKGNVREGALTQKRLDLEIQNKPMLVKVIKIRKDVELISQIHVFFHELVHLVNNHNNQEWNEINLSLPQKEYVAEVCAQALLFSFVGGKYIYELPDNKKWDQSQYISMWIKNSKLSNNKIQEMWRQIEYSYDFISKSILNKIKN